MTTREHGRGLDSAGRLKELAKALVDAGLDDASRLRLGDLADSLSVETFRVVLVGDSKTGKTSAVNALLGQDLLPVSATSPSRLPVVVQHGKRASAWLPFGSGALTRVKREVAVTSLPALVAWADGQDGNGVAIDGVADVFVDAALLGGGIQLVDTPPLGTSAQEIDGTVAACMAADLVVFAMSCDRLGGAREMRAVEALVRAGVRRIVYLGTGIDRVRESEREAVRSAARSLLRSQTHFGEAGVMTVSLPAPGEPAKEGGGNVAALARQIRDLAGADRGRTKRERAAAILVPRLKKLREDVTQRLQGTDAERDSLEAATRAAVEMSGTQRVLLTGLRELFEAQARELTQRIALAAPAWVNAWVTPSAKIPGSEGSALQALLDDIARRATGTCDDWTSGRLWPHLLEVLSAANSAGGVEIAARIVPITLDLSDRPLDGRQGHEARGRALARPVGGLVGFMALGVLALTIPVARPIAIVAAPGAVWFLGEIWTARGEARNNAAKWSEDAVHRIVPELERVVSRTLKATIDEALAVAERAMTHSVSGADEPPCALEKCTMLEDVKNRLETALRLLDEEVIDWSRQ